MTFEDIDSVVTSTPGAVPPALCGAVVAESGLVAVLDALPEMVQLYDSGWRWVYLNPPAREWMRSLGRDPERLIGQHLWDEFVVLRGSRVQAATERAAREERETSFEARSRDAEHHTRIVPFRGGFVTFTSDRTDAKRRARRSAFFTAAGNAIAEMPADAVMLRRLVELAQEKLGDLAAAYEFRDGALVRTSGGPGEAEDLIGQVERMVELHERPRGLVARMAEAGGAILVRTERKAPAQGRIRRPGRLQSAVLAPVMSGDTPFGAILVGTTTAGRTPLVEEDRRVVAEIAHRAGLAIALTQARHEARAAAARTERLQRAAAALGISVDRERTLDLLLAEVVEATGAYMGAVYGQEDEQSDLRMLCARGLSDCKACEYDTLESLAGTPIGDAIRQRQPIFVGSAPAWRARYGFAPEREGRPVEDGSWAALPLLSGDRLLGAMALGFDRSRSFAAADRAFLLALAQQCTRALERAHDLDALRRSEERYRATFEHAGVGISHVSLDGRVLRVNRHMVDILGYTEEDLLALGFEGLTHPEDHDDIRTRLARLRDGTIDHYRAERRYIRKDGATVWVDATVSCARDEDPPYLIVILEDITARKEIERQAEERQHDLQRVTSQLQLLFRATSGLLAAERPQALLARIVEELNRLTGVDQCFHYVLDESEEEPRLLLETSVGSRPEFTERHRTLRMGESISGVVARDRRPVILDDATASSDPVARVALDEGLLAYACFPLLADGRVLGTLAFGSHERTRFGPDDVAVLRAIADQLAIAIDRARSLHCEHEARRQAERASQAKTAFLATVSHELRTPLNAVIGYTDLLGAGVPETIGPGASRHVRRIRVAARHLLQLIEEVLTYSRLEAGREEVRGLDVLEQDLLSEIQAVAEPLASDRGLRFMVEAENAPAYVRTDPRKLRQVLLNLIGNAVKFTERGEVRLSLACDGGSAVFAVTDTGIGIAEEDFDRLFEPFWQVGGGSIRISKGSGLGLTICRRFTEILEGSIEVRSKLGEGTTFTLRLPLEGPTIPA